MARCALCGIFLQKGKPEEIFRLARKQRRGICKEALEIQKRIKKGNLCKFCAEAYCKTGLRLGSLAQIRAGASRRPLSRF